MKPTTIKTALESVSDNDIAIIGMAAHLPGAPTVDDYWTLLREGREAIQRLSEEELLANGESQATIDQPNYVPSTGMLDDFADFDPDFFGLSPKDAAIMDPQHRQFLEAAWEAFENAGHPPEKFSGRIGVFAGCGMGSYFYFNVCSNPDLVQSTGMFLLRHTGNDKDFMSTRVSHIFDLKGPSLGIQTACSTSLVAVHAACQSLLLGESDMALAGGVTINLPHGRGYLYQSGEVLSPDGHCHAFDHRAEGTVFGSGAATVLLRRAKDAIQDGDNIWAIVKGTAVNNDGSDKAGYLAPSVDGQAQAMAEAIAVADVPAETIGYVECHGTGTYLGDPIEVAAMTQAYGAQTDKTGFCRIGSVKTNIGHLDTAAGAASLIKATLALHHKELPASLNFEAPNPAIDFESSPFKVNSEHSEFPQLGAPRRAGVNSLGVGGTNAHAILQEAPELPDSDPSDWPFHPIIVSGRSKSAVNDAAKRLAAHLRANPDQPLADVAYTLKEGRRIFERRRIVVAETHEEAAELLEGNDPHRVFNHMELESTPELVFMFPGGGAQYAGMARDLYETEPVFSEWMDRGVDHLAAQLDYDPRALWLPEPGKEAEADEKLLKPSVQLPLILITEIALAQLWMSWGVKPAAMIGHSMGENAAACVAGVMSFEDAIDLVLQRGRLFDTVPAGGMLSVPLPEAEARKWLGDTLDMASVNAPDLCVVSGPDADLEDLTQRLAEADIEARRVAIDIAAHSRALEPILKPFGDHLRKMKLSPPTMPVISNATGEPLTVEQATDPEYWVAHLRNTVRFADGIAYFMNGAPRVFLECGPGKTLGSLTQANGVPANQVLPSLRHPKQAMADDKHFMGVLARLWAVGVEVDWTAIWADARRHRVVLPSYPFQRQTYFIEPGGAVPGADIVDAGAALGLPKRVDEVAEWGWQPSWRLSAAVFDAEDPDHPEKVEPKTWLVFADEAGLSKLAIARLRGAGHRVIEVHTGDAFAKVEDELYILAPERGRDGYYSLVQELMARGIAPQRIGHFWNVTSAEKFRPGSSFFHRNLEQGFWSLLFLCQALAEEEVPGPIHITSFTTGAASVKGEPVLYPERAASLGPVQVIPKEQPGLTLSTVDLVLPVPSRRSKLMGQPFAPVAAQAIEELMAEPGPAQIAWRGERRYERTWRAKKLPETKSLPPFFSPGADGAPPVVLMTGGLGGIGQSLARKLAGQVPGIRLALLSRSALPDRSEWPRLRADDDPLASRIAAVEHLEAAGAKVHLLTADVCNIQDMTAARDETRKQFGRIDVVVHAAGVVDDAPFLGRDTQAVETVLAPKVHGTEVLDTLFPDGSVRAMVVFSSSSTATAPVGQVDYVAANSFLDAWAESRAGGRTRALALAWGIWSEIGMAANAVVDPAAASKPASVEGQPLLTEKRRDTDGNRVFSGNLVTKDDWVLDGHRIKSNQALLPGTGYLELLAEAVSAMGDSGAFAISDLFFFRPMAVADDATREVRVRMTRSPEGYAVDVRSGIDHEGRTGYVLHAQASVQIGHLSAPGPLDVAGIDARCQTDRVESDMPMRSPQEDHLNFGPRWRTLRAQAFGDGEGIARLSLSPKFADEPEQGWRLHPALLDIATGWAMRLIPGWKPDVLWVPVSYSRAVIHDVLPSKVVSWVKGHPDNGAEASVARFDVVLAHEDGRVVAEIEGLSLRHLEGELSFDEPVDSREVEFDPADGAGQDRTLSPAEARLHAALSRGIKPEEGADAFLRALALPMPRLTVSSMPLPELIEATAQEALAATAADAAGGGTAFARPDLDNEFVEPKNDIERTLVGFWQELLGVEEVGTEDSFFDLGGHSLIAVRLFAMTRKTYKVDFPISVLFEAPTIAACSQLIEDRIGPQDSPGGEGGKEGGGSPQPTRRFLHLVPMHKNESGDKPPFFLVAGMFGNVLNLRHLAQLVGPERAFYGLQARGLYGDDEPHRTFEEAARDYIAEMRQVQPEGPWYIGGFSGGGLTAWEMARQLEAEGEQVPLTVLLDTPLPIQPPLTRQDRAIIKLSQIKEGGPQFFKDWAQAKIEYQRELKRKREQPEASDSYQFHNEAIERAFREALPRYNMKPRNARTILFRPPLDRQWKVTNGAWVSREREYVYEDNAWGPYAPRLEVIEVPGDHDSMVLEPNVRVLAAKLQSALAEAEAEVQDRAAKAEPTLPPAEE